MQIRDEQEFVPPYEVGLKRIYFLMLANKTRDTSLGIIFETSSQRYDPPVNQRIPIFCSLNEANKSLNWSEFDKNPTEF